MSKNDYIFVEDSIKFYTITYDAMISKHAVFTEELTRVIPSAALSDYLHLNHFSTKTMI